jgi:DNA-binding CsgD family transcriptional regulator
MPVPGGVTNDPAFAGYEKFMNEHRIKLPLSALLLVIATGGAIDIILDRPTQWLSFHIVYELCMVAASALMAAWLWNGWRQAEREGSRLRLTVAQHESEREAWRARAAGELAGFGRAVDEQFTTWRLTPAERQVALQLLKGRSHKEIAAESGRSERTVRQHATAAYAKAGVDGRAALAAFFMGGINLPAPDDHSPELLDSTDRRR